MDNILDIDTIFSSHWVKAGFEEVCSYCNNCRHRGKLGSISICWNGINEDIKGERTPAPKVKIIEKRKEKYKIRRILGIILRS